MQWQRFQSLRPCPRHLGLTPSGRDYDAVCSTLSAIVHHCAANSEFFCIWDLFDSSKIDWWSIQRLPRRFAPAVLQIFHRPRQTDTKFELSVEV